MKPTDQNVMGGGLDLSKKLLERENEAAIKAKSDKITKQFAVARQIGNLLRDNNLSWLDWSNIIDILNVQLGNYINSAKASDILTKFLNDELATRPGDTPKQ